MSDNPNIENMVYNMHPKEDECWKAPYMHLAYAWSDQTTKGHTDCPGKNCTFESHGISKNCKITNNSGDYLTIKTGNVQDIGRSGRTTATEGHTAEIAGGVKYAAIQGGDYKQTVKSEERWHGEAKNTVIMANYNVATLGPRYLGVEGDNARVVVGIDKGRSIKGKITIVEANWGSVVRNDYSVHTAEGSMVQVAGSFHTVDSKNGPTFIGTGPDNGATVLAAAELHATNLGIMA